jgi:xylulokinase
MPIVDCGIDIGTTNVKIVLVGDGGEILHTRSIPSPRGSDGIGSVTDALALVSKLENLIIESWKQLGGGSPLRSISAAGVGEDGVGIRGDLTPTGQALSWFDRRAGREAEFLNKHHSHLSARAGTEIKSDRTAAKWLWLHNNRPQELTNATCWVALTDFPAVWWSSRTFMSSSLAPRTACYDVHKREWLDELLQACHAPKLPPILKAGAIVGGVRDGPLRQSGAASSETLVVAGGHDHPIAATLIRRLDPNARVDSMGTANLLYGETEGIAVQKRSQLLAYSIPPASDDGIACLGVLELSAAIASIETDSEHFRSYLAREHLPGSPPQSVENLEDQLPDRDTRIRRGLEAVSFRARQMLDAMSAVGVPKGAIYATGGWSRSRAFVELRASVFGEAISVIGDMELTAMGAALFGAATATGKSVCPFENKDIVTIDPVKKWVDSYQNIYTAFF